MPLLLGDLDECIDTALHRVGGGLTRAAKIVAKEEGVSKRTIRRAYDRHIKRNQDVNGLTVVGVRPSKQRLFFE